MKPNITVREISTEDIHHITNYWVNADADFLRGMGADIEKIPTSEYWENALATQIAHDYHEKQSYCMIWLLNGAAIGHCNVNKIVFGQEAYMHLHMWKEEERTKGLGTQFVKLSIPFFFRNLHLETLYCEPTAFNAAPNKTLPKLGFEFVEEYSTTPGIICFEQNVKLWKLDKVKFDNLYTND